MLVVALLRKIEAEEDRPDDNEGPNVKMQDERERIVEGGGLDVRPFDERGRPRSKN